MSGLIYWPVLGLALRGCENQKRYPLLLLGLGLACWMMSLSPDPILGARILTLHLLSGLLTLVLWHREQRLGVLGYLLTQLLLSTDLWAAQQYLGQDSLSGWVPVVAGVLVLLSPSKLVPIVVGLGWLGQGWLEFQGSPSWLRPAPTLLDGFLFLSPPVPFEPYWLGCLSLLIGLTRTTRPAVLWVFTLALLGGYTSDLASLNSGDRLAAQQVARLLPSEYRKTNGLLRLDPSKLKVPASKISPDPTTDWLAYSNNPENLKTLRQDCSLLFEQALPPGRGRLFASHFNTSGSSWELQMELHNPTGSEIEIQFHPSPFHDPGDPGTRTRWTPAFPTRLELGPGERHRWAQSFSLGNGRLLQDLESSGELQFRLAATQSGYAGPLQTDLLPREGSQSRGLYLTPDRRLSAQISLEDGPQVLTLDRDWLQAVSGEDQLAGNYAVATQVELSFGAADGYRCLILALPSGGWAQIAGHSRHAYSGIVLFNQTVTPELNFHYLHNLSTNSYAPVRLLILPYQVE